MGLLWGGSFSLIASLAVLWVARFYGYEYNFLIGAGAFIIGFFLGLLIESLVYILRRK